MGLFDGDDQITFDTPRPRSRRSHASRNVNKDIVGSGRVGKRAIDATNTIQRVGNDSSTYEGIYGEKLEPNMGSVSNNAGRDVRTGPSADIQFTDNRNGQYEEVCQPPITQRVRVYDLPEGYDDIDRAIAILVNASAIDGRTAHVDFAIRQGRQWRADC